MCSDECMVRIMTMAGRIQAKLARKDGAFSMHTHAEVLETISIPENVKLWSLNVHKLDYRPDPEFGRCMHARDLHKIPKNHAMVVTANNHSVAVYSNSDGLFEFDPIIAKVSLYEHHRKHEAQLTPCMFQQADATVFSKSDRD